LLSFISRYNYNMFNVLSTDFFNAEPQKVLMPIHTNVKSEKSYQCNKRRLAYSEKLFVKRRAMKTAGKMAWRTSVIVQPSRELNHLNQGSTFPGVRMPGIQIKNTYVNRWNGHLKQAAGISRLCAGNHKSAVSSGDRMIKEFSSLSVNHKRRWRTDNVSIESRGLKNPFVDRTNVHEPRSLALATRESEPTHSSWASKQVTTAPQQETKTARSGWKTNWAVRIPKREPRHRNFRMAPGLIRHDVGISHSQPPEPLVESSRKLYTGACRLNLSPKTLKFNEFYPKERDSTRNDLNSFKLYRSSENRRDTRLWSPETRATNYINDREFSYKPSVRNNVKKNSSPSNLNSITRTKVPSNGGASSPGISDRINVVKLERMEVPTSRDEPYPGPPEFFGVRKRWRPISLTVKVESE